MPKNEDASGSEHSHGFSNCGGCDDDSENGFNQNDRIGFDDMDSDED
jgi:hypothetical protein